MSPILVWVAGTDHGAKDRTNGSYDLIWVGGMV